MRRALFILLLLFGCLLWLIANRWAIAKPAQHGSLWGADAGEVIKKAIEDYRAKPRPMKVGVYHLPDATSPPVRVLVDSDAVAPAPAPRIQLFWTWSGSTPGVLFNVYEQIIPAPQAYWTVVDGKPQALAPIVTTAWFTNGWKKIATVSTTHFSIVPAKDTDLIHGFIVTAVDPQTGIESDPATK